MTTDYEQLSLVQAVRLWKRPAMLALALAANILFYGFDNGVVGNTSSMTAFQRNFGTPDPVEPDKFNIPSMWYGLWSVFSPIGTMLGAVLGGWLQDYKGRKFAFTTGGIIAIGGILLLFLSDLAPQKHVAFLFGKLLHGLAIGVIITSTQTYMSEVIPRRLRGPALAFFPVFQLVGQLIATGISLGLESIPTSASYKTAMATAWPLTSIPILLGIFLPESPALLLRRGQDFHAWASFVKIHGETVALECSDLFDDMRNAMEEERSQSEKVHIVDCFRGTNLRRTAVTVFANDLPDLFGLSLLGNATYILQQLGIASNTSFTIQLVGLCGAVVSNCASFWTLLWWGRRPHIVYGFALLSILWIAMGFTGIAPRTLSTAWAGSILLILVIATASMNVWPASFVVGGETSSLRLRAKTSGVGWLFGSILRSGFDLGMPYLYNADEVSLDLGGKIGFVFCGTCALGFIAAWFSIPELKGRSTVEVDRLFERRIPAWKFSVPKHGNSGDDELSVLNTMPPP